MQLQAHHCARHDRHLLLKVPRKFSTHSTYGTRQNDLMPFSPRKLNKLCALITKQISFFRSGCMHRPWRNIWHIPYYCQNQRFNQHPSRQRDWMWMSETITSTTYNNRTPLHTVEENREKLPVGILRYQHLPLSLIEGPLIRSRLTWIVTFDLA